MARANLTNGKLAQAQPAVAGPHAVADYIHTMSNELAHLARAAGCHRLSYMLDVVSLEAKDVMDGALHSRKS
jgi:hypothetical protein